MSVSYNFLFLYGKIAIGLPTLVFNRLVDRGTQAIPQTGRLVALPTAVVFNLCGIVAGTGGFCFRVPCGTLDLRCGENPPMGKRKGKLNDIGRFI